MAFGSQRLLVDRGLFAISFFSHFDRQWFRPHECAMSVFGGFKFSIVLAQSLGIVSEGLRNATAHRSDFFNKLIGLHDVCSSLQTDNSIGVTNVGTNNPSIVLTCRMCSNLLAFARWTQFQVNRK